MKRVLVIEDQPIMRRNIQTILEMEGFDVGTADNGKEGVEAVRNRLPDLILCDVMMPELDGYGVLAVLRQEEQTARIPFIFLTAKGEKADLRAGMNLGADDYLAKPVSSEDLVAAINARLERQRAHEEQLRKERSLAGAFNPDFSSPKPLEQLGLTPKEAEVLLWVAQGKSNADVAVILGMADTTVKRHLSNMFPKLGVETRNAATLMAFEILQGKGMKSEIRSPRWNV